MDVASGLCREENDVRKEVSGRAHHIFSIGWRQGAFSFNKIQIAGNPELLERENEGNPVGEG